MIRSANRPELADALDSIATQTYRHIEVILVDVEGHGALIPEPWCGQFPLRTTSTGAHLGRGAAANVGITAATGHYVVFLDDDDWFLPDHVACLVNALQRSNTSRAAYSGIECRRKSETGDWEVVHVFNEPHDATRLLIENYLPIHAVLFERSLVDADTRFDETLNVYEDWDFWVQLSTRSNFVHVDRITAVYRIAPASGFGVRAADLETRKGLETFFARWRTRWTLEQVIAIAGYTKHQVEMARADSKQYRANVQAELVNLHEKVAKQAALEQTVEELQEALKARETRIANLEIATDGRLTNLGRLSAALSTCQARVAKLEADDAEKSARIHELDDALEDKKTVMAELVSCQARVVKLEADDAEKSARIHNLSDTFAEHKKAMTELQASLRDSTTQLLSARSELDAGRERIHELRHIILECESKGANLERALAAARDNASSTEQPKAKARGQDQAPCRPARAGP